MNEEETKVVCAMSIWGGSFVNSLAQCFVHADRHNFLKLKKAFPEYWKEYEEMAKDL